MLTLRGDLVRLRALEPEDLDFLFKAENTEQLWGLSQTQTPFSKHILKHYLENAHLDIYEVKQLRLVIETLTKEIIGFIDVFDFDPKNKRAGIGILILEPYHRGKGYGKQALNLLCNYCFKHLLLHQVYANIEEENNASIKLFTQQGFVLSGVKKDWNFTNGTFTNELLYQYVNNVH